MLTGILTIKRNEDSNQEEAGKQRRDALICSWRSLRALTSALRAAEHRDKVRPDSAQRDRPFESYQGAEKTHHHQRPVDEHELAVRNW